jgi:hypothetical protein
MRLAVSQMKYSGRGTDRQAICVIYALDLCFFCVKKVFKKGGGYASAFQSSAARFECEMCSGTCIGF